MLCFRPQFLTFMDSQFFTLRLGDFLVTLRRALLSAFSTGVESLDIIRATNAVTEATNRLVMLNNHQNDVVLLGVIATDRRRARFWANLQRLGGGVTVAGSFVFAFNNRALLQRVGNGFYQIMREVATDTPTPTTGSGGGVVATGSGANVDTFRQALDVFLSFVQWVLNNMGGKRLV